MLVIFDATEVDEEDVIDAIEPLGLDYIITKSMKRETFIGQGYESLHEPDCQCNLPAKVKHAVRVACGIEVSVINNPNPLPGEETLIHYDASKRLWFQPFH